MPILTLARPRRLRALGFGLAAVFALSACAGAPVDKRTQGQIIGGAAGAALGSTIGAGSGKAVAIGAGAVLGAIAGGAVAENR